MAYNTQFNCKPRRKEPSAGCVDTNARARSAPPPLSAVYSSSLLAKRGLASPGGL